METMGFWFSSERRWNTYRIICAAIKKGKLLHMAVSTMTEREKSFSFYLFKEFIVGYGS